MQYIQCLCFMKKSMTWLVNISGKNDSTMPLIITNTFWTLLHGDIEWFFFIYPPTVRYFWIKLGNDQNSITDVNLTLFSITLSIGTEWFVKPCHANILQNFPGLFVILTIIISYRMQGNIFQIGKCLTCQI